MAFLRRGVDANAALAARVSRQDQGTDAGRRALVEQLADDRVELVSGGAHVEHEDLALGAERHPGQ